MYLFIYIYIYIYTCFSTLVSKNHRLYTLSPHFENSRHTYGVTNINVFSRLFWPPRYVTNICSQQYIKNFFFISYIYNKVDVPYLLFGDMLDGAGQKEKYAAKLASLQKTLQLPLYTITITNQVVIDWIRHCFTFAFGRKLCFTIDAKFFRHYAIF